MKSEKELKDGYNKIADVAIPKMQEQLNNALNQGDWDTAMESCFTLLVNLASLEAIDRIF